MRDSSYNSSNQSKQIFSRGGEKKVMKKSFSVLLSAAVAFGSFASFASAADELTAQQKFEELKAKGIFTGVDAAGNAGLDQNMNRAQFARVAALILGLEGIGNPDTKTVTEKPFPDVDLGKWFTEEVAAVKEAKVLVGNADGTFNPTGNISVQELAVVTANVLGLKAVEGAKVEGAADWAAGYIQAIKDAGISFPTNYTQAATRSQLVEVSYQADAKINPVAPAKVSVASAKATGVSAVTVTLDKAVDDTKAKLTLKRGTAEVATTTKWSDDKKTATLTLTGTKITEADYSVTLSGIAAEEIASATASFKGEKETVTKIEFVTSSEEVAKSKKAKIKVKADNQYGELASFPISSYTVNTGDLTPAKKIDDQGYLIITVDTSAKNTGLDVVPVYVYFNDTRIMANKTFKVGSVPFVSKMETADVAYNNESKALVTSGNVATIPVSLYDQYGNPVTPEQETADGLTINWSSYITPYTDALVASYDNLDDAYKVKVTVAPNKKIEKTGTYQINIFAGAASQSTKFEVKSEKVAKKVAIGEPSKTIAAGDSSALIPITVTDESGTELTAQEIVDNQGRINVTGGTLIKYGKDKGKVRVTSIPTAKNSYFSLSVMINSTIGEAPGYDNKTFQVAETRIPTSVVVATPPTAKAVLGANSDFKVIVKDQYGEELDSGYALADTYTAEATVTGATYATANGKDANAANILNAGTPAITYTYNGATGFGQLNDGFTFDTTGVVGTAEVKVVLKKGTDEVSSKTVRIETIPTTANLSYSLESVGELYAALDNKATYLDGTATQLNPETSKLARQVKVVVKDSSGNTVAFPDRVIGVVASDLAVANTSVTGAVYSNNLNAKGYIIGNKAGTGSVTVYVEAADGTQKALTASVTVKNEPVVVKSLSAKDEYTLGTAIGTAATIADVYVASEVKSTDQYGISIEKADVAAYDKVLGVRFVISDIHVRNEAAAAADKAVTLAGNSITVGAEVEEFTITAVSRDGKITAATLVKRP